MKSLYFIFLTMLYVPVINGQGLSKENKTSKTAIHTLLNTWHENAASANFEGYFTAMDDHAVFVGTDAKEVWTKKEFEKFSKPHFDKQKAWDFKPLQRNIYVHNSQNIAWFDETLNTWMGVCRGSGVVEKTNNVWKIKHYVLSVAIPNEDITPIIKIKQHRDSMYVKSLND